MQDDLDLASSHSSDDDDDEDNFQWDQPPKHKALGESGNWEYFGRIYIYGESAVHFSNIAGH